MIRLNQKEWRIFRHLQRKHRVPNAFLRYNISNIQKTIMYETWPRIVIRRYAIRKRNRVFLIRNRLRRVLFDQSNRKIFVRLRQNIRQWSKRMVAYKRRTKGTEEYVEEIVCTKPNTNTASANDTESVGDVSKQLKKQLELLKSGRRQLPLIESKITATAKSCEDGGINDMHQEKTSDEDVIHTANVNKQKSDRNLENIRNIIQDSIRMDNAKEAEKVHAQPAAVNDNHTPVANFSTEKPRQDWQDQLEYTPEKQIVTHENVQPFKQLATDEKTEKSQNEECTTQKSSERAVKTGLNFLDMLMCKVTAKQVNGNKADTNTKPNEKTSDDIVYHHEHSLDSTDEFLGFEETERLPGMLMTPIVPFSGGSNKNSVFVSETLNEYMRANDLETDYNIDEDKAITRPKITHADLEGLVTLKTQPPPFEMPAVPDNLLRFRTVAERKSYLSKFSKNYRLSIINNEANIYRELQKRIRYQKTKHSSQLVAQSASSSMSFTRIGWQTASFINTEFNKYYYQMLDVDCGKHLVRLRGVRGNNEELRKKPYISTTNKSCKTCRPRCVDLDMWQDFKPIQTVSPKTKKLNKGPLPSVFKPCPLSHKALQKPLDDDAAALLLAGGSMAVVRMPTVELEVFPEFGRPLNEIAKRYLQYILPHHDISREWAEFSVSTLRLPGSLKDAVQAAADSIPRKSFTFLIPYLNDRNHVLVRRVVDRSEKLDQSFENSLDSELVPKTDFTFRQNLDNSDETLLECADVVSDMINTVAISCSENSFIKIDPDMLNEDKTDGIQLSPSKINRPPSAASNGPPTKKPTKQKRVLLELKRLNATIIDAAMKPEEDKTPCTKDYCAMGCICNSLAEGSRLREHCGKAKCILDCSCKASNQSRIMRLETDGRTITTEDAFMLRRKATARLARMEKEFTSTVVLTENETLLINETNNDKKRRCTKVPKRYEYEDDSDDDPRMSSPKKAALTTIDNEKNLAVEFKELREPVYIKDSTLEQMKHCTVNLVKLENIDNIAPWCMIHQLYKCFCKGRALEGKPMIIEKDENNTTIEHVEEEQHFEVEYKNNTKPRYTFEKVEKKKKCRNEEEDHSEDDICAAKYDDPSRLKEGSEVIERTHQYSEDDAKSNDENTQMRIEEQENPSDICRLQKEKPKRNLEDVRTRFYASRPECCRRQIPIPRRMFLYCNRKRRLNVLKYIKNNETEKTRLLLNEHVMRSVYYHKVDNEKSQKRAEENSVSAKPKEREEVKVPQIPAVINNKVHCIKNKVMIPEVVDLSDDEDKLTISTEQEHDANNKKKVLASLSINEQETVHAVRNIPVRNSTNEGVITMKKFGTLSGFDVGNSSNMAPNTVDKSNELKLPKISNCFSLNVKASQPYRHTAATEKHSTQQHQHIADFTSATSVYSTAFNSSSSENNAQQSLPSEIMEPPSAKQLSPLIDSDSVRDVYNNVIRTMNSLVSKKMQDVDFALKRDSHIIPSPNADILCMMKWSNFLEAFSQGFAFIWQVKSREGTYLVATVRNLLPMICDAMGVVNITALKSERLPLMGKMLLQNFRNEHTAKLAIVMQGKQSYWVVKGFLKAEPTTACNKPTPETHPSLTKKINVLCTSLVKQRQKDEKNKEMLAQRWPAASKSAKVAQIMPTPRSQPMEQQMQQTVPPTQPATVPQIIKKSATFIPSSTTPLLIPPSTTPLLIPSSTTPLFIPPSTTPLFIPPATTPMLPATSNPGNKLNNTQNSRKRKSSCDLTPANVSNSPKMDSYAKMSTNIEFRKVTREDIDEIHLPEIHKNNHKWLVLDLHNDFSHIFVPDFRDLVSLDRIQKVINFARQKNKIVKLQFFQNAPFDAFVTPKSGRKIYFGPLDMNMKPPTLILLQSVDGQMMLRELYQLKHNIQKSREERTKAFWLLQMNGQTHFEVDVVPSKGLENCNTPSVVTPVTNNKESVENMDVQIIDNIKENDDEDCMIIDEDDNNQQQINTKGEERYNFTIGPKLNDKSISITPQTNSLPGAPPIQKLINSSKTTVTITSIEPIMSSTSSLQKIPNTNTIIKPVLPLSFVKPTGTHQLAPPPNTIITGISTTTTATNTNATNSVPKLLSNAVITGTSAPQETPYSSTIFISSTLNANNSVPILHTSDLSTAKATNTLSPVVSEVVTVDDDAPPQCETIAQKRRSVSVVCHNAGKDINSQSIAVNAVINKILPENVQDIQVNKAKSGNQNTLGVASTIGSTTIRKVSDKSTFCQQNKSDTGTNNEMSIKPVVFDISFVDGMDEPAASIVMKPQTPTKPSSGPAPNPTLVGGSITYSSSVPFSTGTITASVSKPTSKLASCLTKSVNTLPTVPQSVSNSVTATRIQKFNIKSASNRRIGYKVVRIPNSLASAMGSNTEQTQIHNKLLCHKPSAMPSTPSINPTTSPQQRTLLNTTNPIKLTPITPCATNKSTIKSLENVTTSITITPVPQARAAARNQPNDSVKVLSPANLPSRCVTIRQILPKPTAAEVLPTTQNSQSPTTSFKPQALTISTDATSSSTSSSLSSSTPAYTNINSSSIASTSPAYTPVNSTSVASSSPAYTPVNSSSIASTSPAYTPVNSTSVASTSPAYTAINSSSIASTSPAYTPVNSTSVASTSPAYTTINSSSIASTSPAYTTGNNSSIAATSLAYTTINSSSIASTSPPYTSLNSSSIASTSNSTLNTLNPPLAITSVQTLGTKTEKVRMLPSHIQYGYIVSMIYADLKFVAKRVMEEFYVKVPSVGILKLIGLTAVNNYLNKHMLRTSEKNTNPGNWHFMAASKAIQIQNHQKSLMVRKTQSNGSKEIKLPTRLSTSKSDSGKSQKVVNVTSLSEPILIDD